MGDSFGYMEGQKTGSIGYFTRSGEWRPFGPGTSGQFITYDSGSLPSPHTLVAGDIPSLTDSTAPTTIAEADAAAAGSATTYSHRDHRHGAPSVWTPSSHGASSHTDRTRAVWLPAGPIGASADWISLAGASVFAQRNSVYPAIDFDSAASEAVQSLKTVEVPDDFSTTVDLVLVWTNLGAGTGNVVWRVGYSTTTDTGSFAALTTADITVAAPAQNILKYTVTSVTVTGAAVGGLITLSIGRLGADAADTLGNDAGFLGYRVRYTADS